MVGALVGVVSGVVSGVVNRGLHVNLSTPPTQPVAGQDGQMIRLLSSCAATAKTKVAKSEVLVSTHSLQPSQSAIEGWCDNLRICMCMCKTKPVVALANRTEK